MIPSPQTRDLWGTLHAGALGVLLGTALLKFGSPVIFDSRVPVPETFWEIVMAPWPMAWGYALLGAILLAGLPLCRLPARLPRAIIALPLAWFLWQLVCSTRTQDPALTAPEIRHFAACAVCFYLGLLVLSHRRNLDLFWLGLLGGMCAVMAWGFDQHFGGLEETRRFIYSQPGWQDRYSIEFLEKITSSRIASTLFYPNTLAGALLLLLPPLLVWIGRLGTRLSLSARATLLALLGGGGLCCMAWSGSKGGWLLALLTALAAGVFWIQAQRPDASSEAPPARRRTAWVALALLLALGIAGFAHRYAPYFRKGATSAGARWDYWTAAVTVARENPVWGSGPGTFGAMYRQIRPEGAEMARLAHNDYLQQCSDSGLPGGLLFAGVLPVSLVMLFRARVTSRTPLRLAMALGLAAWAAQEFIEFGLHIPALAWPAFLFLGLLWGKRTD